MTTEIRHSVDVFKVFVNTRSLLSGFKKKKKKKKTFLPQARQPESCMRWQLLSTMPWVGTQATPQTASSAVFTMVHALERKVSLRIGTGHSLQL